jgi:hypothetical protein
MEVQLHAPTALDTENYPLVPTEQGTGWSHRGVENTQIPTLKKLNYMALVLERIVPTAACRRSYCHLSWIEGCRVASATDPLRT